MAEKTKSTLEVEYSTILAQAVALVRKALPDNRSEALKEALHMCLNYYSDKTTSDDAKDENQEKVRALSDLLVVFGFEKV